MNLFKKKNSMYVSFTQKDLEDEEKLTKDLVSIIPSKAEREKFSKVTIALSEVDELSIQNLYLINRFAKEINQENKKSLEIELKISQKLINTLKNLNLSSFFTTLIPEGV